MRRKVKTFLHVLLMSILPQTFFYAKIIKSRLINSIYYFLTLLFFISLTSVFIIFTQLNKNNLSSIQICINNSMREIPDNFILNIKDGFLSTNHEMPLFVWFHCNDEVHLLAVTDERASKKDITSYGAHALFTGSEFVLRYKDHIFSAPYQNYIPNIHMEKKDILLAVTNIIHLLQTYIPFFIISLILFAPLLIWSINIFNLCFSTLCVYIFYALFKKHYSLKKIFQIGLHSCSLPLVISPLFLLFPIHIFNTLVLYLVLFFIFHLVGVYEAHYLLPHKRS